MLLVLGVGFTPDSMRSGVEGFVDSLHYGGADTLALAKVVKVIILKKIQAKSYRIDCQVMYYGGKI